MPQFRTGHDFFHTRYMEKPASDSVEELKQNTDAGSHDVVFVQSPIKRDEPDYVSPERSEY